MSATRCPVLNSCFDKFLNGLNLSFDFFIETAHLICRSSAFHEMSVNK